MAVPSLPSSQLGEPRVSSLRQINQPPEPPPPLRVKEDAKVAGAAPEIEEDELEFHEIIGKGVTAEVYRGTWFNREVAIKQIFQQSKGTAAMLKHQVSFLRELEVFSKIEHENLVKFFGVCFSSPPRVVTEFCSGGTLFELLHVNESVELCWPQKLKACSDIAKGMHYLHTFTPQIIHRDLKSLNLLLFQPVFSTEDVPLVKVSDFGTARMKDLDAEWQTMTKMAGTCHWMAPEVFQGSYDEKVDVYSFSMVLFEIMCEDVPFGDQDGATVLQNSMDGDRPDWEEDVPPDSPPALVLLMIKCWAQEARERPSFMECLEVLQNCTA